jgi:hypothetical protein
MQDHINSAAHWWSTALHECGAKHGSRLVSDATSPNLPPINDQQVEVFHASLQQLLREAAQTDINWSRPLVLFVNSERACPELTTAAEAAGIGSVHRILPEDTVMRIYPDEVMVTRGYQISPCKLEIVWSAHEEEETASALRQLARLLDMPEGVLRQMVGTKQLELYRKQGCLHFRCNDLEGTINGGIR